MRTCIKIVPLFILIFIAGCAGSSRYMTKATPIVGPSSAKALVYFMRPSGIGFAINFQIWDGDHFIGLSQAKSYFAYQCDPGRHLFLGIAENKRGIEADLEAGKTFFILTQVKLGAWKARMGFIPVTRGSEYWDKVDIYKEKLNFIESKEEAINNWEQKKKAEAQKIRDYLETQKGKKYVVSLGREDGR